MKKIISLLIAMVFIVGAFAGCSGSKSSYTDDDSKAVTLKIALPQAIQKDTLEVQEEINRKLESLLPNTKIELMLEEAMADKWPLWMSTKKEIDIAHSGFVTDIEDEVRKESYIQLNDLVDEYAPNIKKLVEDYWYSYDNSAINGKLYAIPNIQSHLKETLILRVWNEGAQYFDIDALVKEAYGSDKTTAHFYELITQSMKKAEASGVDCKESINLTLYEVAKKGYTFIGGSNSNLCYDNLDDKGKIINFYDTEEYKNFCAAMKTWANNGWVSKDVLTGQWSDKLYASTNTRYNMDPDTKIIKPLTSDSQDTHKIFDLINPETQVLTTNVGENLTYYSIPFTSKNPARAMKFLDLINSEEGKEINNMLAYGIEGKHYEFVDKENGDIKAFEYNGQGGASVSYGIPNWECGNMMLQYSVYPYDHNHQNYAKDYYLNRLNGMKKNILYGYTFDIEGIRDDLSSILKNNEEYAPSIYSGIVENTDKLISELAEKNKAANIDKVISELQAQADKHISSK